MSKLVRDNIPEIIQKQNRRAVTHIASDEEYLSKLMEKLHEEVVEFLEDSNIEEAADIMEVVYSICEFKKVAFNNIEEVRLGKKEKNGGFEKKIILESIED